MVSSPVFSWGLLGRQKWYTAGVGRQLTVRTGSHREQPQEARPIVW